MKSAIRCTVLSTALLALVAPDALAWPSIREDWQSRYAAVSSSADTAGCQLCHVLPFGQQPWNGYGWDVSLALDDLACDLDGDMLVSNEEAFFCVEDLNSDGAGPDNLGEIGVSTQPGWTDGPHNTYYSDGGQSHENPPPFNPIGPLDPDGTEPPPPVVPPPPGENPFPPHLKKVVLSPGQSIQDALDQALPGAQIFLKPGTYYETRDRMNALNITKSGIQLIGLGTESDPVVIANAGNQRNGIAIVPPENAACGDCHASMEPPFELYPWVEPSEDQEPRLYDIIVRNITIRDFARNGLFTDRVDGFKFDGVHSVDNRNYGIFPIFSRNGIIKNSSARGADDSGIWVETSVNVKLYNNEVTDNTNGFEVSNSDDVVLSHNRAYGNTAGIVLFLLPDIYPIRQTAERIIVQDNHVYDNNRPNSGTPGSVLSAVPQGTGILVTGPDDGLIHNNRIEDNDFFGVAIADYCFVLIGTPFACGPADPPGFIAASQTENNRVIGNTLIDNGTAPPNDSGFAPFAADFTLFTNGDLGNCYEDNVFSTVFSILGVLPPCD